MSYFSTFPRVPYYFGDEITPSSIQNLSAYTDVVDKLKDAAGSYIKYTILEGDRPDNVSQKLYNNDNFYWTFFLLNDHLRRQGWPLTNAELLKKAKDIYPNTTVVIRDVLIAGMNEQLTVGTTIRGMTSGVSGQIIKRNLDLNQLVIGGEKAFSQGELLSYVYNGITQSIAMDSFAREHLSAHHYEYNNSTVDINPAIGPGALLTEITHFDRLNTENEKLKIIKVIKPDTIQFVDSIFKTSMAGR